MDNPGFLFLFNAILLNASDAPFRQGRLLCQAVKHGHISMETGEALRQKHWNMRFTPGQLERAHSAHLSSLAPDPDEDLHQQATDDLTAPQDPFEQDPMDPCGAYEGRS